MATSTVEEFLGLRKQLKEIIRKRNRGNLVDLSITAITETRKKPQCNNFGGSFFGPSEPTIAKRVIEGSKALTSIKPQDLLMKNKKFSASRTKESYACESIVKALEVKKKILYLKIARDYSFLNDVDANLPPPTPAKLSGQRNSSSMDSKKQLNGTSRITPILPGSSKAVEEKKPIGNNSLLNQNKNTALDQMQNSNSKPVLKFKIKSSQPPNLKGEVEKKPTENISLNQSKDSTSSDFMRKSNSKPKLSQPVPSLKLQNKKRILEHVSPEARNKQVEQSKKRKQQLSETKLSFRFIRETFNTKRFIGCDDRDVKNMEAKYDDILKEEKRNAKLAKKEDAEQLLLIEQEEEEEE